ncbi:hypothetical protein B0H11DRAFT_1614720, partial [Mycena galericulata]
GLVHIMDDQERRAPKKADRMMVEVFAKFWGNKPSFKISAGTLGFTISHFNGPGTYSAEGFLQRNLDVRNPDFVSLLRRESDVGTGGSGNPFVVKGLFSGKAIGTTSHLRNEDTILVAQQSVQPMCAPSTRR